MHRSRPEQFAFIFRQGLEEENQGQGEKMRMSRYDRELWKATLTTYAIFGACWWWDETSPLGWWSLKPRTKEEKEMGKYYQRREFPYPGDEEAVKEFVEKGGTYGTTIGSQEAMKQRGDDIVSDLQREKFERESQKLWMRMRREVIQDFESRGYVVMRHTDGEDGVARRT